MFSFNQPNCITHCLLREAPRCRGRGESVLQGRLWGELEAPKGHSQYLEFWTAPYVLTYEFLLYRPHSKWHLLWIPMSKTEQGPVWIQGQTGNRQGVQTDYVILVMNASSTFRPSATLKAGHFPSWTIVSPIMSNALSSAFLPSSSSSFPSSNNFLLIIPSLTSLLLPPLLPHQLIWLTL